MNDEDKVYTLDEHCERLLKVLELPHPCCCCPASSDFKGDNTDFCDWEGNQCVVCHEFVGIDFYPIQFQCPCTVLGKFECIKRTWINLEKEGYI